MARCAGDRSAPGTERAKAADAPLAKNEDTTAAVQSQIRPAVRAYRYEFSQPDFVVSSIRIEHDESGAGTISFKKKGNDELITELARLPGIGRKTAQRLTFHLLQQSSETVGRLASALVAVADRVRPCRECGNPTEDQPCAICADPRRDGTVLCVVEDASAVSLVDRATDFRGRYHVLGGRLSPLDGVGPEALRLDRLVSRVRDGGVREVILATNPTAEGEATALYLAKLIKPLGLRVTRIAHGIPVGGDLEYVDVITVGRALEGRREM